MQNLKKSDAMCTSSALEKKNVASYVRVPILYVSLVIMIQNVLSLNVRVISVAREEE